MDRRAFLSTLTGGLLAAPLAAGAQQAGKVYRIGYLPFSTCPVPPYEDDPVRQRSVVWGTSKTATSSSNAEPQRG